MTNFKNHSWTLTRLPPNKQMPQIDSRLCFMIWWWNTELVCRFLMTFEILWMSIQPPQIFLWWQSYHLKSPFYVLSKKLMSLMDWDQLIGLSGCMTIHMRQTGPVFNTKEIIISLLTDPSIMTNSNYAEGCNVLTWEVDMNNPCNSKYGKAHTGDAWLPTRNRYCAVTE